MNIKEIEDFFHAVVNIESFVAELAARSNEIRYYGLEITRNWESYIKSSHTFYDFDRKVHQLIKLSKFIDNDLYERISSIVQDSRITNGITQIAVVIKIAEKKTERRMVIAKARSYFDLILENFTKTKIVNHSNFSFEGFNLSLSEILVGLNRLLPLIEEVKEAVQTRKLMDNEAFKPANINIDSIRIYINSSLDEIKNSKDIDPKIKPRLIEYLEDTKLQLAEKKPMWKKIVGALVIVSAILSGLAAAPQAAKNIDDAINEILGTTIKKEYPSKIPGSHIAIHQLKMTDHLDDIDKDTIRQDNA